MSLAQEEVERESREALAMVEQLEVAGPAAAAATCAPPATPASAAARVSLPPPYPGGAAPAQLQQPETAAGFEPRATALPPVLAGATDPHLAARPTGHSAERGSGGRGRERSHLGACPGSSVPSGRPSSSASTQDIPADIGCPGFQVGTGFASVVQAPPVQLAGPAAAPAAKVSNGRKRGEDQRQQQQQQQAGAKQTPAAPGAEREGRQARRVRQVFQPYQPPSAFEVTPDADSSCRAGTPLALPALLANGGGHSGHSVGGREGGRSSRSGRGSRHGACADHYGSIQGAESFVSASSSLEGNVGGASLPMPPQQFMAPNTGGHSSQQRAQEPQQAGASHQDYQTFHRQGYQKQHNFHQHQHQQQGYTPPPPPPELQTYVLGQGQATSSAYSNHFLQPQTQGYQQDLQQQTICEALVLPQQQPQAQRLCPAHHPAARPAYRPLSQQQLQPIGGAQKEISDDLAAILPHLFPGAA